VNTFQVSQGALARGYAATYQGRVARACLAINPGSLTVDSTTADWDAAEITGQAGYGYSRVIWTLPAGAYSGGDGFFKGQVQNVTFQANGSPQGLQYNSLYLVTGTVSGGVTTWATYIEQLYTFSPTIALASGEPQTYPTYLLVDEFTV
jgi:hypothetical protein